MQAIDDTSTITEENEQSVFINRIPFPAELFAPTGKAAEEEAAKITPPTVQITCASRRRPMDTSEYALAHGTLYHLGSKTSKRARKQQKLSLRKQAAE
jgi:hypothetical protein